MLLWILQKTFGALIGKLPEDKKEMAWEKFKELLAVLAEAGVKGAVEAAKDAHS